MAPRAWLIRHLHQTPQDFPNSNGPNAAFGLGHGHHGGTSQDWRNLSARLSTGQQADDSSKLLHICLPGQAGRPWHRSSREAPQCLANCIRDQLRNIVGDLLGLPSKLLRAPDGRTRVLRNFELLGAAVGVADFTHTHTAPGACKSPRSCWMQLGSLKNPQIGLRLLRACAGQCKVVHSMRCALLGPQLRAFQEQWEQAGLSLAQGTALGWGGCAHFCGQVDGGFDLQLPWRTDVAEALGMLNERGAAPLTAATALTLKQKELTTCTDKVAWERRLANSSITAQAILRSEAEPGAAVPAGRKRMELAVSLQLRQRLCMPETSGARVRWHPRQIFSPCWPLPGGRGTHSPSPCPA